MKSFRLSSALVRSASVLAVATGLALPGAAMAQAMTPSDATQATTPPTDPQQGTPQANAAATPATAETGATATNANPETAPDEIVVTGIRASLERSISIKRNSTGIVDAISAEDIGKFPDTNLAESLQRITGVSIDRVNGEGAQVTVRGFGPDYNLVTLNGRTLASTYSQTVGGDESGDGIHPITRSFDFSNLASEGVKTLEVYKTGRSAVPSGGIGATINVVTRRPLDAKEPGLNGSLGAKADWDTSTKDCEHCGSHVTPELTGLLSWSNQEQNIGVSVFGSYQKRDFSTVSATSNAWNIVPYSTFLGYTNASTVINNAPTDPNQLVSVPNDSRYHFADDQYKRFNGQAVIEFKPSDSLTLTADVLYANTVEKEQRSDEANWFNRPFDVVTLDGGKDVDTTTYLHEVLNSPKDEDFEQQSRAQKNTLQDYGLNAKWDINDRLTLALDGHYGKSAVLPHNSNGTTSTLVGTGADVIASHSIDYSGPIPVQDEVIDDSQHGNNNGTLDFGDVGSSVGRTYTNRVHQTVKEGRADFGYDLGGGSRFDFGGLYRDTKTRQEYSSTQQILGNWSVDHPGDIQSLLPNGLQEFCLLCKFHHYDPQAAGDNLIAFRGNAVELNNALGQFYGGSLNPSSGTNLDREKIWAGYAQITWKGEIAGMDASLVAGARYEHTTENTAASQLAPIAIVWNADNDFTVVNSTDPITLPPGKTSYDNVLPAMDFQVSLARNLIGRFSFSKTLARPDYNLLFPTTSVTGPPRPSALGGYPTASNGNTDLQPLTSDNLDLSLEYYFKPDSYISVGFFDKRVHNFIGNGTTNGPLLGLLDPTSATAGTRSGAAKAALQALGADISDVNLFTYTALLDNFTPAEAAARFAANYDAGSHAVNQGYANTILSQYDIVGKPGDPEYQFTISQPINNKDAQIYGVEVAGQYFFGQTGIGVSGSFTYVNGDVSFDNGAAPTVAQFALTGLSNTANATLIYDKHGVSARLSYNWRDKFLSNANRGDTGLNPVYTRAFGQLDMNISYDITPNIAVSIEGINLTNESLRTYGRETSNLWFAQELQRRFLFGARYRF